MNENWTTKARIDAVIAATGATQEDAIAYLLAEEGDITNAIISYKGDRK